MGMKYNFISLEQRLNKYVSDNMVSGLSLAIAKDGNILFSKCFGDSKETTLYRLASLTKPITAVAVLICEDLGFLKVDDYIDKYIPFLGNFKVDGQNGTYRITIRELLSHSSGFPSSFEDHRFDNGSSLEKAVETYKNFTLQSIPGTKETYSNEAYDVAARIVEIVSKMKYEDFLKKYIFDPLGMKDTCYYVDENRIKNMPVLCEYKDGVLIPENKLTYGFDKYPNGFNGGGAGLLSTLSDYLKFAIALTNKGEGLISKKAFEEMIELYKPKGYKSYFGLGVYLRQGDDWEILPPGAFGWSGAYGGHYFSYPKENLTVVYMHNSISFGGAGAPHTIELEKDINQIFGLKKN